MAYKCHYSGVFHHPPYLGNRRFGPQAPNADVFVPQL